ncbi:phospholipase b-related [Anaeramoeba flamelloides]|uniref:Phospholipase B-like n=1 Tax=Anaeramoeba flamelloides TaxID=1746091 RepID=A0AAV7YJZ3_9EUKA|nr:phospholipase b-related [Anaeramoeba flamelloides]
MNNTIEQILGIADGLNWESDSGITWKELYLMNIQSDLSDIANTVKISEYGAAEGFDPFDHHCSGLVKLLEDGSDLYSSHATWQRWFAMLRQLKYYEFHYQKIPSTHITFSSYAAIIYSKDDFYLVNGKSAVLETLLFVFDQDLYKYVKPESSILSTFKVVVCNRQTQSGPEWADCFKQYNSGAYNNGWLAVDYEAWETGNKNDVVWSCEQMPGLIECMDISDTLFTEGYIPSYNIPRFPKIYNYSDYASGVAKYGYSFFFFFFIYFIFFGKQLHMRTKMIRISDYF